MNRDDDPQLWDLLAHSKVPEVSPFFARNVVRAVRLESSSSGTMWSWLHLPRLIPTFSALAAVLIAVFTFQTLHHSRPAHHGQTIASGNVPDSELATDLDVLSGDDDSDDAPLL